ncbi:unnamed protein product [Anisakis simplex]|uniref:F-box domain-containing protein n=1 Tax=Anisakis simplex TaxID=6269 RepID=A0A0M3K5E8_ANISI|nr:unnamed protein product [Anisakis simplex]
MHPVDLVNGVSKVSKRWNALAKTPSLYRYVRARKHVRKLCVVYEKDVFFDVFPDCMPNVTFLDIAYFPDLNGSAEKLVECFPSVQVLKISDVSNLDDSLIKRLFPSDSFKNLRQLDCSSRDVKPENFFGQLCETERPLQSLHTTTTENLRAMLTSPIRNTLTELSISEYLKDSSYAAIGQLTNLKKLSIFSSLYGTDEQLMQFKTLSKLEHLHLDCCGEDCDFSYEGVAEFFELPSENAENYFPYRLKHLLFTDCHPFHLEAANALVKSCPQLISLNLSRNCYMGEEGLSVLVKNLRNLRFLDLSWLGEMRCDALRNLTNDDMPKLQFLELHRTKISEKILWALNLKRPNLIISNKTDYFINWNVQNGNPRLNKVFGGDLNSVLNDLAEVDGFCCMGETMWSLVDFYGFNNSFMQLCKEMTQTKLLPFAPKYRYSDKRYRFTDRGKHGCEPMGYPTLDLGDDERSDDSRPAASQLTKKALPDVVLLNIFKYIHPIDLVNGISRVSKRWNALAKTPSLYRFVRVLINKKSTDSESAKKFLERVKNFIRKLCMVCEINVFDVFPECMPNVTFLDITSFPDTSRCADKLMSCFPSVEELILSDIKNFDEHALSVLFSKNAFKRLRRLHFANFEDEAYKVIEKLCECERRLQFLSITNTAK